MAEVNVHEEVTTVKLLIDAMRVRLNKVNSLSFWPLAALFLLAVLASGCSLGQGKSSQPQPAGSLSIKDTAVAEAAEATQEVTAASVTYTGDVKPKVQISLSTKTIGRIEELNVDVGSVVRAGEVIGHLDQALIRAQLGQAEAALAAAKAKLAQLEDGPRPETVAQAEANLRAAQAKLAQLKAGPTPEQLEQAEIAVRVAKNQLYAVQAQADAYLGSKAVAFGQLVFTKEMKEAQAGTAYEQVKLAEARLAELKAGPTPEQLAQAQAAVDAAQAALDLAKNPFSKYDLDAARAAVAQAQANVDTAKAQLAETNIIAPIDGIVTEKFLSVGALAAPQVPILNIISSELEVVLSVEEARAGQIKVGQPVSLTVAAYPNETFSGQVSSIGPAVDPRSRTFSVKVNVRDEGKKLKAGMFAKVTIDLTKQ